MVFLHLVTRICIFNIVCHEDRHDWSCVSFTFVPERKNSNLEYTTLCMSRTRKVVDDGTSSHHLFLFWKSDTFFFDYPCDHGCDLNQRYFTIPFPHWIEHPYNVVM